MKLIRQFDVFRIDSDEIHDEIIINDFDLAPVRSCLKNTDKDPMLYNAYRLEGELKVYFENLGYKFNTSKFEYYLCCYQDNVG